MIFQAVFGFGYKRCCHLPIHRNQKAAVKEEGTLIFPPLTPWKLLRSENEPTPPTPRCSTQHLFSSAIFKSSGMCSYGNHSGKISQMVLFFMFPAVLNPVVLFGSIQNLFTLYSFQRYFSMYPYIPSDVCVLAVIIAAVFLPVVYTPVVSSICTYSGRDLHNEMHVDTTVCT